MYFLKCNRTEPYSPCTVFKWPQKHNYYTTISNFKTDIMMKSKEVNQTLHKYLAPENF